MSVDSSPFMRFVPFLCRTFFPKQRQMEGVIQSDQTPETPRTEGEKGHMKQEAPWRPQTRTKCVDELMSSGLWGQEEIEGKISIRKERKGVGGGKAMCVCVYTF